ncbi:MAG: ABC transporter substrate-binding protein [Burkholderiaceae bacterium]
MIERRRLLALAGLATWRATPVRAQPLARRARIGVLSPAGAEILGRPTSSLANFAAGMRELGHVEGGSLEFVYRFADQAIDRLPVLAAELVALRPDVVYTHASAAGPMARATSTIPIVVGPTDEATMVALTGSPARPQRNVTGTTLNNTQLNRKCIQLLKEIAPGTRRVAVVVNPGTTYARQLPEFVEGAAPLGVAVLPVEARCAGDVPRAFAAMAAGGADAVFLPDDLVLAGTPAVRMRFIEAAAQQRLPLVSSHGPLAAAGGLLSLGTDIGALARRAAYYVHRLLEGARPSDLPVERPTTFKLTINLKTARALGLTVPAALLLRADEVTG